MSGASRRRLVFAAVTALLFLAPAAPAHADESEEVAWHSPPCATGEITSSFVEPSQSGGNVIIRLEGWSALCQPSLGTQQPYQFGLVLYSATDGWIGRQSVYSAGTGPTAFTYRVDHTLERPFGPIVAACLAYGPYDRLSCVAVDFAQAPFVVPIPVDDPRVKTPTVCAECPSCVGEPPPEQ